MPGKCSFSERWLRYPAYADWLEPVKDRHKARCKICLKTFDVSVMGESALRSHVKGKKHIELARPQLRLPDFFALSKQPDAANDDGVQTAAVTSTSRPSTGISNLGTITAAATTTTTVSVPSLTTQGNDVLKSEILWCLKVVTSHYSLRSCEKSKQLFQNMFPDSTIAASFSCGETKCRYLSCYGISPYFRQLMMDRVKNANEFVLLFDESLNNKTQTKQLDIHVRMWENDTVSSRFLTSQYMGHATADDLMNSFYEATNGLHLGKVLQLSMDGPNVNWRFHDDLDARLKRDFGADLLNIGSCGLHVIHNAFKNGASASTWDLDHVLFCLHTLFKDSPARREDYIKLVGDGEEQFPLKFCKHRWVENSRVVDRAIKIWPNIVKYVKAVEAKKVPNPKTKSYQAVKERVQDELFVAKMCCFSSISKQLEPFLTLYQTDQPMIPFLCSDLQRLIRDLMDRVIKDDVITGAKTAQALQTIDISDKKNHKDPKRIKLGFKAHRIVTDLKNAKKISDLRILEICTQAKDFVIAVLKKMLEKCPIKYSLVRNMGCLDPREMCKSKHGCECKLKRVLHQLVAANKIDEEKCDNILRQYSLFVDDVVASRLTDFSKFDTKSNRVDVLLYRAMVGADKYKDLFDMTKMLLLLSHGQASVERGFSINRQIEVENLREESYTALRIICDHVIHVGGIFNVNIEKPLLIAAAGARQKYLTYLDNEKRNKQNDRAKLRRKAKNDEIDELKRKRQCLLKDIESMYTSADKYSEKAESSMNLTFVAKANSLRRSAKEKQESLNNVDVSLDEKLKELKDC